MTIFGCICLIGVFFFFTAVVSVVTGGTSLITVPVMMQCGMDPHVAVARNIIQFVGMSQGIVNQVGNMPICQSAIQVCGAPPPAHCKS